jgi:glucose/arabinose dehydrogenase
MRVVAAVCAAAVASTSCASDGEAARPAPPRTGIVAEATPLATFANTLTGFAATDEGELLVGDRLGAIWRFQPGASPTAVPVLEPRPVLDLTDQVSSAPGERGFFNMVLTPDQQSLIVDYTSSDGAITVRQFPYEPGKAIDASKARTLLDLEDPYAWHHGGGMAVDRHGNLLVGIGDMEFRQADPPGPQDPDLLLGGVLRIPADVLDDDGPPPTPTAQDMVARGLRNPWRLGVDPSSGEVLIGDVGLDSYEEVDRITAAQLDDPEVTNFGWPYREGPAKQQGGAPKGAAFTEPVIARPHEEGTCGIVGGLRYRGTRIPALQGRYVYGDLCGPALRAVTIEGSEAADDDEAIAELDAPIVSIGEAPDGELYALGSTGVFARIDPGGSKAPSSDQAPQQQATTTTIARSSEDCAGGIVAAVYALSDAGSMTPEELVKAVDEATAKVDAVVPNLPESILADGQVVQRTLHRLSDALDAAKGNVAEAIERLRPELMAGKGPYEGFPEAMAKVVDSECG